MAILLSLKACIRSIYLNSIILPEKELHGLLQAILWMVMLVYWTCPGVLQLNGEIFAMKFKETLTSKK